jgi:hypothetical protein
MDNRLAWAVRIANDREALYLLPETSQ